MHRFVSALLRWYIGTLLQHGTTTEPYQVSYVKPSLKLVVAVFPRLRIGPLVGRDSANNQRGTDDIQQVWCVLDGGGCKFLSYVCVWRWLGGGWFNAEGGGAVGTLQPPRPILVAGSGRRGIHISTRDVYADPYR